MTASTGPCSLSRRKSQIEKGIMKPLIELRRRLLHYCQKQDSEAVHPSKRNEVDIYFMGFRHATDLLSLLQVFYLLVWIEFAFASDTLIFNQSLGGSDLLISSGQNFKFGFFRPANSTHYYVGVMYNVPVSTVVWVANRDRPLIGSSGTVEMSGNGNLVVLDGKREILWSSNVSVPVANSSVTLLDTGNLVLQDFVKGSTVWESFQNPSDCFLPKMKLTTDLRTSKKNVLTSWRSDFDPALGSYTASLEPLEIPQVVIRKGADPYWRSGPWNGQVFIGVKGMDSYQYQNGFDVVTDDPKSVYVTFTFSNASSLSYFVLNSLGNLQQKWWSHTNGDWEVIWSSMEHECNVYGKCGPFGICNPQNTPVCSCLRGFEPKNVHEWNARNWTNGCTRKTLLQCEKQGQTGKQDGFFRLRNVKLPDNITWVDSSAERCDSDCLGNCSCIAYAYQDGIGCMQWTGRLIDVQKFSTSGSDLYIRLPHSELNNKKDWRVVIAAAVVSAFIIMIVSAYWLLKLYKGCKNKRPLLRTRFREKDSKQRVMEDDLDGVKLDEFPFFKFEILLNATRNFDPMYMLGQGGFGPVYKGKLSTGQEIAVKRLARSSNQGPEEFKNEVEVISKLQHRNLVSLLGCCVECEEKMLVYEYMPNGSLDAYLFDSDKQYLLDWNKRMFIIEGISRGLLYLHRDSRLRIIHRDLKAGNILLDGELNPKISDFGMARIFGGKENQANTNRVVGTLGYMAPEYALEGRFSEKSDVFSFGVLLLEIVSGRKNTSFYSNQQAQSLVAYAWKLWQEDKMMKLVDPLIYDPEMESEIGRCAHVGLLCVQEAAEERPGISTVLSMLSSEIVELPHPKKPAFIVHHTSAGTERSESSSPGLVSTNDITVTMVEGR